MRLVCVTSLMNFIGVYQILHINVCCVTETWLNNSIPDFLTPLSARKIVKLLEVFY